MDRHYQTDNQTLKKYDKLPLLKIALSMFV